MKKAAVLVVVDSSRAGVPSGRPPRMHDVLTSRDSIFEICCLVSGGVYLESFRRSGDRVILYLRVFEPAHMHSEDWSNPGVIQMSNRIPMIYIVGNSYCGSTLLGFLLSSHPHIIFLGELQAKTWLKDRSCSCGQPTSSCTFYRDYFTEFNNIKVSIFEEVKSRHIFLLLFRRHNIISSASIEKLESFYNSISHRVSQKYPGAQYIVDSSKSIWLLNGWLHTSIGEDIKIIWLRRQLKPNVASIVKRGSNFFRSLYSVLINDLLIKYFLQWNNLKYLELNYSQFHEAYAIEAKATSSFLEMDIPLEYENHFNHHVISGNPFTRKQFTEGFSGFHKDDEWKSILTKHQKMILSWID